MTQDVTQPAPQPDRHGTTKDRLVRAAFALFDERGFDNTTVDDIAARAGVGRTTFFRAFATKEDVVLPDHDTLLVTVRERLAAAGPGAALVAITEAAGLVLQHYLAEGELARARYRLTSTVPALRAREITGQRQYQRLFHRFVRTWMSQTKTGHADSDHSDGGDDPRTDVRADLRAELMADAVVTAHNHVLRRWLHGHTQTPEADLDAAMAEVLALFADPVGEPETAVVVLRTGRDLADLLPALRQLTQG